MTEQLGDWQPTACILCECNCGIVVQVDDRTWPRIRGDKEHPASQGYTCNKALRLDHYQNNRNRLTSPMRRTARRQLRGNRLGHRDFRDRRGLQGDRRHSRRRQDLLLRRRRTGQPPRRRLQRRVPQGARARTTAPTRWPRRRPASTGSTRTSTATTPAASSSMPRCRCSSARTRGCRRASRGPAWCCNEIANDPARSMIVIDPVITDTAKMADFHLRVRPGTDAWCLAALAAVLVQENLCDEAFLAEHVTGVEAGPRGPRAGAGRRLRAALRRRRGTDARRGAPHRRPPAASRCSRTSASSRHPTARCART